MGDSKPAIIVTGAAGSLGFRLTPFLSEYEIIAVDERPPSANFSARFAPLDLAKEESCAELTSLIQAVKPIGVVHLGFITESRNDASFDSERMWHNNVAGTARVMEAITEANRDVHIVEKFIYPSSALVYGPNLTAPVNEEAPLTATTFPAALQQMETDRVVQQRAPALRGCSVFMLRPQILAGTSVHNHVLEAFRGIPEGDGRHAERMRKKGLRLSYPLPFGNHYLQNLKQFVHIDDLMRVIGYILGRTEPESQRLTLLNVAADGNPLTVEQCAAIAKSKIKRVPGNWGLQKLLAYRKKSGVASIPAEFADYLAGQSVLNTDRLKKFLASDYKNVMHYANAEAFSDSFTAVAVQSTQSRVAQR